MIAKAFACSAVVAFVTAAALNPPDAGANLLGHAPSLLEGSGEVTIPGEPS